MIESHEAIYQPTPQPYDSLLRPWRELVRPGDIPGRPSAILGGLTGAILRFTLVFLFLVSVLALIWWLSYDPRSEEYMGDPSPRLKNAMRLLWSVLGVWHCAVGFVVVFSKIKLAQLRWLATLVNLPVVMCLVRYQQELGPLRYLIFGYLDLWLVFLLVRWPPTYKLIDFLNDEIHYYLID